MVGFRIISGKLALRAPLHCFCHPAAGNLQLHHHLHLQHPALARSQHHWWPELRLPGLFLTLAGCHHLQPVSQLPHSVCKVLPGNRGSQRIEGKKGEKKANGLGGDRRLHLSIHLPPHSCWPLLLGLQSAHSHKHHLRILVPSLLFERRQLDLHRQA